MTAAPSFLALRPGADPLSWSAVVDETMAVGDTARPTLFGGAGLGLAVQALERSAGRPLICATAQFVAFANKGDALTITVSLDKVGFQITQARAVVRRRDGQDIVVATAALGARAAGVERSWIAPPRVPPPDRCPPIVYHWSRDECDLHGRLDVRVATPADAPDGRMGYWIRAREAVAADAAFLAVLGDFVPTALGAVLPSGRMTSLDNSLRIIAPAWSGDWILCDNRLEAVRNGLGHGAMLMFAQDGALIATAGQSLIVRS